MPRAQWRKRVGHPGSDCHRLALDWQRRQCGRLDTPGRHAWVERHLQALAPGAGVTALAHAMKRIRHQEQQEQGLLDPRIGLLALSERAAMERDGSDLCARLHHAAGNAPLVTAAVNDGATDALATLLLDTARHALPVPDAAHVPLGRYDTFARAFTSALVFPGQLTGLRNELGNGARALERLWRGPPSVDSAGVAGSLQGYLPQEHWSVPVQVSDCTPSGMQRALGDALIGRRPPAGTALARTDECHVEHRIVAGLNVLMTEQIGAFMRQQVPCNAEPAVLRAAYQTVLAGRAAPAPAGSQPRRQPEAASRAPGPFSSGQIRATRPFAQAGALTDQGLPLNLPPAGSILVPGAVAQAFGQLGGHAPLVLLRGLIDALPGTSWWGALPGHVTRTPEGLRDALEELFELAGEPLRGRPPGPASLQRFLDSTQGAALFASIDHLPGLQRWQRDDILRGGEDTRLYVFLRMLQQLMRRLHAGAQRRHTEARPADERTALHLLSGIGEAADELLSQYSHVPAEMGSAYFARARRNTRAAGAEHPSPLEQVLAALDRQRDAQTPDACPPIDVAELRRWLVQAPEPLMSTAQFDALSDGSRCLAQIVVLLAGVLGDTPSTWRGTSTDARTWRSQANALVQESHGRRPWEIGVNVYFHDVARLLRGWLAQEPDPRPSPEVRALMQYVRDRVEPLQQLYSALELPLEQADPHYRAGRASYQQLYDAVDAGSFPSGRTLARRICPPGAASVRDGLAARIEVHVTAHRLPDSDSLPALWNRIIHGPHALQQWLDSDAGRAAVVQWSGVERLRSGPWQSRAAVLREAVLSQLPMSVRGHVPPLDRVPSLFAPGSAPVLSLATRLLHEDPTLQPHPAQALWLAIALLPHDAPAAAARLPLAFPLLPMAAPPAAEPAPTHAGLALLPDIALARGTPPPPAAPRADTHALPALDTLLSRFGLDLLHGTDATMLPADLWALMSRTQAFAELGETLLRGAGWADSAWTGTPSPQNAELRVAQALLERYVGRDHIAALRDRLNAPASTRRPFVALAAELRDAAAALQPQASATAINLLQWLLASELEQPALCVQEIPYWLDARSLQGASFLQGVELLEALQPGASARAHFDAVCALPAQLARPGAHAGDKDALNAVWARAMLRPALYYAAAHGMLPELRRLDAATSAQATTALELLKDAQELQSLHLGQISSPAPRRRDIAARILAAAGVDRSWWDKHPDDLPRGYLERHGIVPSTLLSLEQGMLELERMSLGTDTTLAHLIHLNRLVTAGDTVRQLVMADAYLSTSGPSTHTLFDAAFEDHRRRVETGLAGVIETLLNALPVDDLELLRGRSVTPMRLQRNGRDGYQGLLLRCDPAAGAAETGAVYIEVFPSAGVARRAWTLPGVGAMVESQSLLDGVLARHQQVERVQPVDELDWVIAAPVAARDDATRVRAVAQSAAQHLWTPWLDKVRADELARHTRLEAVWTREQRILEQAARFSVPFYACGEDMAAGDASAGAVIGCVSDVGFALIPAGTLLGSTVRIVRSAGEHAVLSLASDAGHALVRFGVEIAGQSGVFLLRDLGRGALWTGRHAWQGALAGNGWLRQVLRQGRALDAGAPALEQALLRDGAGRDALEALDAGNGALAAAKTPAHPHSLLFNAGDRWFHFDPLGNAPFGPPVGEVTLLAPPPARIPAERTLHGIRFNVGDGTPARFVERAPDQWEVWIEGRPYRWNADEGVLQQRELHGREPGALVPVDEAGLCRVRRGLEEDDCSARPLWLRFVPDATVPLSDHPTLGDLGSRAIGDRQYRLHTVRAGDDPAAEAPLEGAQADTPDQPGPAPVHLMVHEGEVCRWGVRYVPPKPKQRPQTQPLRLIPVSAEEARALGVPPKVQYLPIVGGYLHPGSTLGLPAAAADADAVRTLDEVMPVVELGPIATGINDGRRLRGIVMPINGDRSICIEADAGIFYEAPFAADRAQDEPLHFVRLRDQAAQAEYLRRSEAYRFERMRISAAGDRLNIARMAFNYLRSGFSAEQRQAFASYEDYVRWCDAQHGGNALEDYADEVLSAQHQQQAFVELGRKLIPDWSALQSRPIAERAATAEVLNQLLPVIGKAQDWSAITAERLANADIGTALLAHVNGANLAYLHVRTRDGQEVVYYALSGGQRAKRLQTRDAAALQGNIRYVDARREVAHLPPNPDITSLPVLRHPDQLREIVFERTLDAERLLATSLYADFASTDPLRRLDPAAIGSVQVFTLMDACASCGGVVLPQLRQRLPEHVEFSVRYLKEYT